MLFNDNITHILVSNMLHKIDRKYEEQWKRTNLAHKLRKLEWNCL